MDISLVFGIELPAAHRLDDDRYEHQEHSAAVQCGNGQHIHYRKVYRNERGKVQHAVHRVGGALGLRADVVHHIDDADGPRHLIHAHGAVYEVAETQPHKARKFKRSIPCVPQLCAEGGLLHAPD